MKAQTDSAIKLKEFTARFGRLISIVAVIAVTGLAFVIFHSSPPKPKHCTTEACFDPKFSSCTPATFDYSLKGLGSVRYQIMQGNLRSGGCYVTVTYTNDPPNPSWVGKPMTCVFNNKLTAERSAATVFNDLLSGQNTYGCTGPLVSIIQAYGRTQ